MTVFCTFVIGYLKSVHKHIGEINPWGQFINVLQAAFTYTDPKSTRKDSQDVWLFCAFGICKHKRCL